MKGGVVHLFIYWLAAVLSVNLGSAVNKIFLETLDNCLRSGFVVNNSCLIAILCLIVSDE